MTDFYASYLIGKCFHKPGPTLDPLLSVKVLAGKIIEIKWRKQYADTFKYSLTTLWTGVQ